VDLKPGVGVASAVVRDGRLLLGRRIASFGNGLWQTPGGKIDSGESPAEAVVRETYEETGLHVTEPQEIARQFDDFPEIGYRYETIFFGVRCDGGEPLNREPDKCAGWSWHPLDALPEDRFAIDPATIDAIRGYVQNESLVRALRGILGASFLSLATTDARGLAYASYVPYACVDGSFGFAVSGLAAHAKHLALRYFASLLIVGDAPADAYARARLTVSVRARVLAAGTPAAERVWDALERRHGSTVAILRGLGDFTVYASAPEHGRLVLGFASAYDVSRAMLAAALGATG
jgi:8-oxo-dGTP diphosphatase